jgi:putative PEP-CTERM system histidine kinase
MREVLVNAYVSQQALLGSVSFILIGLYLIAIGLTGEWIRRTDQSLGIGLSVIMVFGALVGLAIAVFSRTVRAKIRTFVSRNFYQSKYDYRAQWLNVTEAFQEAATKEIIIDRLLDLLIRTFSAQIIAIWAFREADRRFCQVRPVSPDKELMTIDLTHPVITELSKKREAAVIEERANRPTADPASMDDSLARSGAVLCFPIRSGGRLSAFIALGPQPHGEAYGADDYDLLYGICHHVGALLSHTSLAEERQAAAELEALHRFSVFCLHDIKNLAARLSLVAQNAERHGHDPAFQESALRTVADTARKMMGLMSKLSLKSLTPTLDGQTELVDIRMLIEEIVAPLRQDEMIRLHIMGAPILSIMAVREQVQQVLLNVVLNARQAITNKGNLSIILEQSVGSAIIRVEDTGNGIPIICWIPCFVPRSRVVRVGWGSVSTSARRLLRPTGGLFSFVVKRE